MNDALHREAWDKGSTDILYVTVEYSIIQFLHNKGIIIANTINII